MIRILHLSDIHYDFSMSLDFKSFIMEPLMHDLANYKKERDFDLLIISGDLINKGGNKEDITITFLDFEEKFILPLLKVLDLSKDECFFVPGNHDIDRTLDDDITETGMEHYLGSVNIINQYIDANREKKIKDILPGMRRIIPYKEFERQFYLKYNEKHRLTNFESLFIKNINGLKVGISCFNSSWRCYDSTKDKGKIILGERQIINSTDFMKDLDVKIALMHHPLDWFNDIEKKYMDSFIKSDYDLLFCGHTHQGSSCSETSGVYGNILISRAPANWQYSIRESSIDYLNGYSIVDYEYENECITVHNRMLSYEHKKYVPNVHLGTDDGIKHFKIWSPEDKHKRLRKFEIARAIDDIYIPLLNEDLLSYRTETCAPKSIDELFICPSLVKRINLEEDKETCIDSIEELCSMDENIILLGTKESGKTMLLDKLLILFARDISKYQKIPVLIKFNSIQNRIETLVAQYLKVKIKEVEKFLKEQRVVLLLDDVSFDRGNEYTLSTLKKFIETYEKTSVIITSFCRTNKKIPIPLIENAFFCSFQIMYISEFKTKEIRQLIQKWFANKKESSLIPKVGKILNTFMALNLPRTPLAVSMFLWIIEQQEDYKPVNQAAMLENYIQNLFKKQRRAVLSSDFDYKNKEWLLSEIAYNMYRNNHEQYYIAKNDLIGFITEYLKDKKFSFDSTKILNDFLKAGILFEENKENEYIITFQFNCFFEYFLTKKMEFDRGFREFVLNEGNFLKFVNEIDYYTALKRDQIDILEDLLSRLDGGFNELEKIIQKLPNGYDTLFLTKDDSIFDDINIEKITEKGKPTQKELDELQDEALEKYPMENKVCKKEDALDPLEKLDKLWELTAKVLKNTEEIKKGDLKAEGIKKVITSGQALSCLYKSYIVKQLLTNKNKLSPQVTENMELLTIFMPLVCESVLYTFVGTGKLSVVLEEKIKAEINNLEISDYEKFVSVFLLADIKLDCNELVGVKDLIRQTRHTYIYDLILFKLLSYYLLRSKNKETDEKLLNILADVQIKCKHKNKSQKGEIIMSYKKLKREKGKEINQMEER